MESRSEDSLEPGPYGERTFRDWLDNAGLCYLYIQQEPEYFSTMFKGAVKRPDFLTLINSIGILAVDVKNRKSHQHFGGYTLDKDSELQQTIAFERTFRLPFWYAYLDEHEDSVTWYWISALHVLECGILKKGSNGDFYHIDIDNFVKVKTIEDMGKLFSQVMPQISKNIEHLL